MIFYKDVLTGAELFNSGFKSTRKDGVIEVEIKLRTEVNSEAVAGVDSEGINTSAVTSYDIVMQNHLQPKLCDKARLSDYMRNYCRQIIEYMQNQGKSEEEIKQFKDHMSGYVHRIRENFGKLDVFTGDSAEEGMAVFIVDLQDDTPPYAMFVEQGVYEVEV